MSSSGPEVYKVEAEGLVGHERIDKWIGLKKLPFSRSQIQKLLEKGMVNVNGTPCKKNYKVIMSIHHSTSFPLYSNIG